MTYDSAMEFAHEHGRYPTGMTATDVEVLRERQEYADGYDAGAASVEGDQPPTERDQYRDGWIAGNIAARNRASLRADQADAEINAALRLDDYFAPTEPDGGGPECWPPMRVLFPRGPSPLHPAEANVARRGFRANSRGAK